MKGRNGDGTGSTGDRAGAAASKLGSKAYSGAMEAVLAIPIGAGLGYLADRSLGSGPWGLLLGLALGFGAFILRIVRLRDELLPGIEASVAGLPPAPDDEDEDGDADET